MNDEMQEILSDFLAESSEILEVFEQHFAKLKTEPTNAEILNEIFRCMHNIKGSAGFLGFSHLVEVAHQGESLLNRLRQGEISASPFIISIIEEAVDAVKLLHADIRETGEDSHVETALVVNKLTLTMDSAEGLNDLMPAAPVATSPSLATTGSLDGEATLQDIVAPESSGALLEKTEEQDVKVHFPMVAEGSAIVPDSTPDLSVVLNEMQEEALPIVQKVSFEKGNPSVNEKNSSVRVGKYLEDHVMNLVGELVLGRNRLMKLGFGLEEQYVADPLVRELGVTLAQLNLVTSDLQFAIMNRRMVPCWNMSSRFPRFVQDLTRKITKKVQPEFREEDTEVDKSVANRLGDSAVNLVRDSKDCGLEAVKGKNRIKKYPEGSMRIALGQEENTIVIRIEDDGRGFTVVADEIHKLIKQTTKATEEMGDMVRQIQQDFKSAIPIRPQGMNQVCREVEQANKTRDALSKIEIMANEMSVVIQQIAGEAEDHSNATQQIAGEVEAMTQTTRQAISGVAESARSCHQLITLANDLRKTVSASKV
jgi:two-component system, chemotaxis family, sensor kinase CheA